MTMRRVETAVTYLLLLPLLLAFSQGAFAVSLGDELILSALGDPVEVEIEVLQWEDMGLDRVQISAATREEYDVFNLTWLPVLENLNFNLVGPDLNGKVRVLVSSRDPLDEPFLELLLVLRWPGGSLRREYVLLFDPPGMPARALTVVENTVPEANAEEPNAQTEPQLPLIEDPAPVVVDIPSEEIAVVDEPVPAAEPPAPVVAVVVEVEAVTDAPAPPPPAPQQTDVPDARTTVAIDVESVAPQPAQAPLDTDRRTYQVRSGESLWNIARQFRPAGAGENLYQVLLSIHNLNRNSFINGNISLLKANAVLEVPSSDDIERIDALSAQTEFERRWDQGTQRYEAAQRGEAIPLFADEAPEEEVVEVEAPLPIGTEAPRADDNEGALIMVSETNVPQPLELATAPAPVSTTQTQAISIAVDATTNTAPPAGEPRVTTRTVLTAELEAELAAMRARRQSAEAIAQQLQDSLARARADRAAAASLFGAQNVLLAGSALVLFGVLVAGIVVSLRLAGDLRSLRATGTGRDLPTDGDWLAGRSSSQARPVERMEPVMPEIDVVELPASEFGKMAPAPSSRAATEKSGDDLFARMDDLIGTNPGNPPKNS
jgi:FimV-like protein